MLPASPTVFLRPADVWSTAPLHRPGKPGTAEATAAAWSGLERPRHQTHPQQPDAVLRQVRGRLGGDGRKGFTPPGSHRRRVLDGDSRSSEHTEAGWVGVGGNGGRQLIQTLNVVHIVSVVRYGGEYCLPGCGY